MARQQTVVKVTAAVTNEEGQFLDTDGDLMFESNKKNPEQAYEDVLYYLLHWGLSYEILVDNDQRYPVSYTVAICQHIKNGSIMSFTPQDITVVGKESR